MTNVKLNGEIKMPTRLRATISHAPRAFVVETTPTEETNVYTMSATVEEIIAALDRGSLVYVHLYGVYYPYLWKGKFVQGQNCLVFGGAGAWYDSDSDWIASDVVYAVATNSNNECVLEKTRFAADTETSQILELCKNDDAPPPPQGEMDFTYTLYINVDGEIQDAVLEWCAYKPTGTLRFIPTFLAETEGGIDSLFPANLHRNNRPISPIEDDPNGNTYVLTIKTEHDYYYILDANEDQFLVVSLDDLQWVKTTV